MTLAGLNLVHRLRNGQYTFGTGRYRRIRSQKQRQGGPGLSAKFRSSRTDVLVSAPMNRIRDSICISHRIVRSSDVPQARWNDRPPSAIRQAPVTNEDASEARYSTVRASSSGDETRFNA